MCKFMCKVVPLVVTLTLGWCLPARADNLGSIGPTYGIDEQDLLAMIDERLRVMEKSGELQRLKDAAVARGREAVVNPVPVKGLVTGSTARTFYFDPTFELDHNIVDANGRLLFPAGTRKNPLEVVSMTRRLLFFDGRDAKQVAEAQRLIAHYAGRVKPILTAGSYLELMRKWHAPVFYDQQGILVKRFRIQQVPALVSQEGMRLRIDELALK